MKTHVQNWSRLCHLTTVALNDQSEKINKAEIKAKEAAKKEAARKEAAKKEAAKKRRSST